jgi:hypothetical protein
MKKNERLPEEMPSSLRTVRCPSSCVHVLRKKREEVV